MVDWVYKVCPICGVHYCLDKLFDNHRQEGAKADDGRPLSWHCPNGHALAYRESLADTLRRERDRLQQRLAERDDEIALQGRQIKKMEKRAAAGTCPCCQRTFSNMATHMRKEHPEFVADNVVKLKSAGAK
jgi:hypothetical protein